MDQDAARPHVTRFLDSMVDRHTLGLVYGRRRIGKSTLLEGIAAERGGFYWEATRGEPAVQLTRLGAALVLRVGNTVAFGRRFIRPGSVALPAT